VSRAKITVLSDAAAASIVLAVVPPFAESAGMNAEDVRRLHSVLERLLDFTLRNAYPEDGLGEIEVTLEAGSAAIHVVVHDWGVPLTSAGGHFGALPASLDALASDAANVELLNLGASGKRLTADIPVRSSTGPPTQHHIEAVPRGAEADAHAPEAIAVRAATPEDAEAIAQLLYENYQLSYVHGDFYRPRYLTAALEAGELVSTLAVHEGRVIGHHALMPRVGVPSAETGAAVVHSAYRGLGIFGRLFGHTLDAARAQGLAGIFGDAVTIHPYSQRAERSHGYRETTLQLGMVPARTSMRGFGDDGPKHRTATLRSYRLFDEKPRGIAVPARYRELLESIYANLGVPFERSGRAGPLDGDPVTTEVDEPRALGFVRLRHWGAGTGAELTRSVRHVLSLHVDVVYADVDLATVADVDEAVSELNELGFFASGLLLHGPEGHDHLRLQRLDSAEIELEKIVCDSPFADELLQRVLEDKARVDG
jgi:GNAT superfamily N-acetyltransferase